MHRSVVLLLLAACQTETLETAERAVAPEVTRTQITGDICRRLGVGPRVLPMSDDRVRTRVRSDSGWIDFQD